MTRYLVLGLLALCCSAAPASAANFTVTKTADTNDGACAPGNCSLRDAVIAANGTSGLDTIKLPSGHFTLSGASGENAAASGDLDLTESALVEGAGSANTVIDGGGGDRIFDGHGVSTELHLTGLTLTGGKELDGAAVLTQGVLNLSNVSITGNTADGSGTPRGVVAVLPPAGNTSLIITNSTISSNVIAGTAGAHGAVNVTAPTDMGITISDSQFASNNVGRSPSGGGFGTLYAQAGGTGTVDITRTRFIGNHVGGGDSMTGGFGGAVFLGSSGGVTTVRDSAFEGNSAGGDGAGGFGGGIFVMPGANGTLDVSGSTFASNVSGGFGGGIFYQPTTTATFHLTNSTVTGNQAGNPGSGGFGGGVFLQATSGGTATLSNTTITSNGAGSSGGGGFGGGLYFMGFTATASNTIFSENLTGGNPGSCSNPMTSGGHNIEKGTTCGFNTTTDQNTDPLLAPLGDYGGLTKTQALLPGSPAIDHGAGCPGADQRGLPRPFGAACDIGAYEYAPPVPTTGAASGLTSTSAVVAGLVSPNLRSASFQFDFGPTAAYGSKSASQAGGGLAAIPVSAKLTGLKPGTTYHYRLAASGDNSAAGADRTFTTLLPSLKRLKLSPSAFPAAPRGGSLSRKTGTNVSYTASDAGTTTFRVLKPAAGRRQGKSCRKPSARNRRGRKCTRYVPLKGSFTHKDKAGANKLHFTGRLRKRAVSPGTYRLSVTPRTQGKKGKALSTRFKILS